MFVDKTTRDKRMAKLRTKGTAMDETTNYIDEMTREGLAIECISGDSAGELGCSAKF